MRDLLIEGGLHQTEEQRLKQGGGNREHHAENAEEDPYIRDRGQQRKQDLRRGDNDDIESVRAEHPGLVAARFLAADLDGLGDGHIGLVHENVRREAVFVSTDDAEHDAGHRDERPQEDPETGPAHAAENALDGLPVFEGIKELRDGDLLAAVAAQINERHRRLQKHRHGNGGRGYHAQQRNGKSAQQHGEQRNAPEQKRLFPQNGKGTRIDRFNGHHLTIPPPKCL